jgi:hypothetical protein
LYGLSPIYRDITALNGWKRQQNGYRVHMEISLTKTNLNFS